MTPSVSVAFTDDNGNIDVSYASEQISIVSTGVTLSGLIIGKTEKEMCTCFAMR